MKKLFLILTLWGGVLLSACIRDAYFDENSSNGAQGTEGNQFLSVSIISSGAGTRAEEELPATSEQPQYQDGTAVENDVQLVRFYFFTASGAPASVKCVVGTNGQEDTYLSYYEWNPYQEEDGGLQSKPDGNQNNIEKVVGATIVIDSDEKDKVPYSVVAVINPSELYTNDGGDPNLSLSELKAVVRAHETAGLEAGDFVMSNSMYLNSDNVEVDAVPVFNHIFNTRDAALDNPVEIYVERVIARLDFAVDMRVVNNKENVYDTGVKFDVDDYAVEGLDYEGNICVKFLGWNVTATPDKSWLMKKVDPAWDNHLFGWSNEPWNEYLRFRSYWAINPEGLEFAYGNFGQALPAESNPDNLQYKDSELNKANANTTFGTPAAKSILYMQENAASSDDENGFQEPYKTTKVIIAAQLVEDDGETPITLAEWGFNHYTVKGLKKLWANALDVYRKTTVNGETVYTKIKPEDITFVTAGSIKDEINNPEAKGRYEVYPKLIEDRSAQWSLGNGENATPLDYEAADKAVRQIGPAKIWNNGYTYYYFDIAHLGRTEYPGEYGVVRNHIYDATISELAGLGTPVYDPDETIYPEKPENDNTMIAAKINILTWRIVKKSIKLEW